MGVDPGRPRRDRPTPAVPAAGHSEDGARPPARRRAARVLLWTLPVFAAVAAWVMLARARGEADLALAQELLAQGRTAEARTRLEPYRESRWFGARARAGLAVAAAEAGTEAAEGFTSADLALLRPRMLLDAALRRGDYEACARLARLLRVNGDPGAAVYEAAARLEAGDLAGAEVVIREAPEMFAVPGLGARVARVLEARSAGATVTVTDRRGNLAGFFDAEGRFHPESAQTAAWVPPAALDLARAHRSAGVRLSVDAALSAAALDAIGSDRGTIVLLDVATGEVLAAVSDARTRARGGTPAVDDLREPASIQKIVTTAATLRAGRDPDAEIARMVCNGSERYRGGSLWCSYPAGPLAGGLRQAMAVSCNVAFANLAVSLGWPAMVDELRRWGFDRPRDEAAGAGRVLRTSGTERDLASLGVGLDHTEISPAHAALFGAVIANGQMPDPVLVWGDDGLLGYSPRRAPRTPAREVVPAGWVPLLQRSLAGVVEEGGTAQGAMPDSFPVAMKTGTASTPGLGYHVNYVGAGPLPRPTIAFCVRATHQPTSGRVRDAATDILGRLLEDLGRRAAMGRRDNVS